MIYEYRSLSSCNHDSTMVDCFYFNILLFMDMLDIDSLVDSLIHRLLSHIFGTVWCNTDMFHLKLLIILSLSIAGQIDWHAVGFLESTNPVLKPSRSPISFCSDRLACYVLDALPHFFAPTMPKNSMGYA